MPNPDQIQKSLLAHEVPADTIARIMAGYDAIPDNAKKPLKATFLRTIMARMDELLDQGTKAHVMDWCACCKGGEREKNIRRMARETRGYSLAEKVAALQQVPFMGHPELNPDGTITASVVWSEGNRFQCPCPCFTGVKMDEPLSITYCYCCAGHFRHHYQNALGTPIRTREVASSALASKGQAPCRFVYELDPAGSRG